MFRVDVWCGENHTARYGKINLLNFPLRQNTKEILQGMWFACPEEERREGFYAQKTIDDFG
ncbi:MAG: hypothetical protein P1P73_09935 [Brevefilum sp.]|nr:hypothetical protein [Brevefilum sp.]MDW7754816.1 hypothetical protein [Brevefilum sp.]